MTPVFVKATTIEDAWFQLIYRILDEGHKYQITGGSFPGSHRYEFDHATIQITHPGTRPLLPEIPAHLGIPNPVVDGYLEDYIPYLMTDVKHPNEDYTYGMDLDKQIDAVVRMYRHQGFGTNQACMSVGNKDSIFLKDPQCLRVVDTRIRYGKLHFILYFRSWDLWGGFPANLGALQMLKEYMAKALNVEDGEIFTTSKGLHIYDYVADLVKIRTYKH